MVLPDVNILVYAFRREHVRHQEYRSWLTSLIQGPEAYGMSDLILAGFLRIVTHPRIFQRPDRMEDALAFVEQIRNQPACVPMMPGVRHWSIFCDLCRRTEVKGSHIWDAYLAALAIESSCEWVSTDRDFARFPGLRWRPPFQA